MKAMIFAAGLGTRLKPLTNHTPKAMVKIGGKPLLEWKIEWLEKWGFNEIIINVHHFPNQVISFLNAYNRPGLQIAISDEADFLLETGGGLKKAANLLEGNEPILVCNVDVLTDLNLDEFRKVHLNSDAIATLAVRNRDTSRYFIFDDQEKLAGWKNVTTGEEKWSRSIDNDGELLAFSGIHFINPQMLTMIEEEGAFSIVDVYLRLAKTQNIKAFRHDNSIWIDVGKPHHLAKAENFIHLL